MRYENICRASFIDRPNRFIAHVDLDGTRETVHVKNTGRCRELLLPGAEVMIQRSSNLNRKTAYDLIAVYKEGLGLVNIDSQAPNKVVGEWLSGLDFSVIRPEYTFGSSRLDYYMEKEDRRYLMEVKGCTLERDGVGFFPDAPTERGIRHLHELAVAAREGYHSFIAFVIPMPGIRKVLPNMDTAPEFGHALYEAEKAGVHILYLPCRVGESSLDIDVSLAPSSL